MTTAAKVSAELLHMNRDALAALVTLGANHGSQDPLYFVTNLTDRFVVEHMLRQAYRAQTAAR